MKPFIKTTVRRSIKSLPFVTAVGVITQKEILDFSTLLSQRLRGTLVEIPGTDLTPKIIFGLTGYSDRPLLKILTATEPNRVLIVVKVVLIKAG